MKDKQWSQVVMVVGAVGECEFCLWNVSFPMVVFHLLYGILSLIPLVSLILDNNYSGSQSAVFWLTSSAAQDEEGLVQMQTVGSTLDLQMWNSKGWSPATCVLINCSSASEASWNLRTTTLRKRAYESMKDNSWGLFCYPFLSHLFKAKEINV